MNLSVVIPVYNSSGSLPALTERLIPVLKNIADHYEIIFINDGSKDNSWDVILRLANRYDQIRGVCLMRNYGQHNAVLCGIRMAQYELIITMDDDLQHPPEEIPKLIEKIDEGFDVVYGYPEKEKHGLWRDMASQVTKWAMKKVMGTQTARQISAFRVLKTSLRDAFSDYKSPFVSIDVLLTWATTKFSAKKVHHDSRLIGKSNYTFSKLISHAINMITGFSTIPLRIASILGFLFMFLGVALLVFTLINYLRFPGTVPGFAFLACSIAIFSGVQLFVLGIIGEYIARLHFRSSNKPVYVVKSSTEEQ